MALLGAQLPLGAPVQLITVVPPATAVPVRVEPVRVMVPPERLPVVFKVRPETLPEPEIV